MKVAQLMSREVVTLGADDPLITAEELMGLRRFRHLPVVEPGDKLVGLVTHKDIIRSSFAHAPRTEQLVAKARTRVREIMRKRVATVSPDTDLTVAAQMMVEHKYGCLPVVEDGTLVGILTEADFLYMVKSLLENADATLMAAVEASLK
ncbi:MAG: CBS domain-containing protein [Deltaproteobacteria bacterium]|nr:MAG: CBS domain-containing protein [Deltaproteobacteria bacterium]